MKSFRLHGVLKCTNKQQMFLIVQLFRNVSKLVNKFKGTEKLTTVQFLMEL